MVMPISNVSQHTSQRLSSVRFSSASYPLMKSFHKSAPLLKTLDFAVLGNTLIRQSMLIYACIIASRLFVVRTNNERLEVLRRDPLGWYMWFMGKPFFEWGLMHAATVKQPLVRSLLFNHKEPRSTWTKLFGIINPPVHYYSSTQKQLAQRYQQIKSQMFQQAAGARKLKVLTDAFTRANNLLVVTSFVSLLLTILGVGIGINLLNIIMTRRNVDRAKRLQELKQQSLLGAKPPALSSQNVRLQMQPAPVIMA